MFSCVFEHLKAVSLILVCICVAGELCPLDHKRMLLLYLNLPNIKCKTTYSFSSCFIELGVRNPWRQHPASAVMPKKMKKKKKKLLPVVKGYLRI